MSSSPGSNGSSQYLEQLDDNRMLLSQKKLFKNHDGTTARQSKYDDEIVIKNAALHRRKSFLTKPETRERTMSFNGHQFQRETFLFTKSQLSNKKLNTEPKKKHIVTRQDSKAIDRVKMRESLFKSTGENQKQVLNDRRKKSFNFLRKLGKRKRGYYIINPTIREEDEDEFLAAKQRE